MTSKGIIKLAALSKKLMLITIMMMMMIDDLTLESGVRVFLNEFEINKVIKIILTSLSGSFGLAACYHQRKNLFLFFKKRTPKIKI